MTIDEIREWRLQGMAGEDYNKAMMFEFVDTLT